MKVQGICKYTIPHRGIKKGILDVLQFLWGKIYSLLKQSFLIETQRQTLAQYGFTNKKWSFSLPGRFILKAIAIFNLDSSLFLNYLLS